MSAASDALALPAQRGPSPLAFALTLAGPLCWSIGPLFVQGIEAEAWTIVFWRSAIMALFLTAVLLIQHRGGIVAQFRRLGRIGLVAACTTAGAFVFYIPALQLAPTANVVVIQGLAPLWAALFGWLLLGERVRPATWAALAIALAGMAALVWEGLTLGGGLTGELLALGVSLCFAASIVAFRRGRDLDMAPAMVVAALISLVPAVLLGDVASVAAAAMPALIVLGVVQLGCGLLAFTRGAGQLPPVQSGLIGLLETVLAPLWTWLAFAESPGAAALLGGGAIVLALVINTVATARS